MFLPANWINRKWRARENQSNTIAQMDRKWRENPKHPLLLTDKMGLGKTHTYLALAALSAFRHGDRFALVVAPGTTLCDQAKAAKSVFGPDVTTLTFLGIGRERMLKDALLYRRKLLVIFATMETARNSPILRRIPFGTLTLDEAHQLKSRSCRAVIKSLQYERVMMITGTPFVNSASDLIALFCLTDLPEVSDPEFWRTLRRGRSERIEEVIQYIREQAPEAPREFAISYQVVQVPMTDEQIARENALIGTYIDKRDMLGGIIAADKMRRNGLDVALAQREEAHLDELDAEIKGISPKSQAILDILRRQLAAGRKCVVTSSVPDYLKLIQRQFSPLFQGPILLIDGGVPRNKRPEILNRFSEAKTAPHPDGEDAILVNGYRGDNVLLLSKRLAIGINLACASVVIIADSGFTAMEESQAEHRVIRADQTRDVDVIRIVASRPDRPTIDQRFLFVQQRKCVLQDRLLGSRDQQNPRYTILQ